MATTQGRRVDGPAGRTYQIEGVGECVSVTTVLALLGKEALIEWAAREERKHLLAIAGDLFMRHREQQMTQLAFEEVLKATAGIHAHSRIKREAAEIGNEAHASLQTLLELGVVSGGPMLADPARGLVTAPARPEARIAHEAGVQWLQASGLRPRFVESQVWHAGLRYAGTFDFAGELTIETPSGVRDVALLGDWKTSSGHYVEQEIQLAAYAAAMADMGHAPEGRELWGAVVRLPKRATRGAAPQADVRFVSPARLAQLFELFASLVRLYYGLREAAQHKHWLVIAGGGQVELRDPEWPARDEA